MDQSLSLGRSHPASDTPVLSPEHVDISQAEAEFSTLSHQLSRIQTHHSVGEKPQTSVHFNDEERQQEEEPFDLEAYLHGTSSSEQAAGIRPKRIGVLWEDLTVSGLGGLRHYVRTFPDAVIGFFNVFSTVKSILGWQNRGREVDILSSFRGVAKPGEMVLVLGRPDSGCTTFLRVIANQRQGYTKIDGEVRYGRFSAETFAKRYRGQSVYNQEDDVHHPTLTVGQTLGFALDTKTPGKKGRPLGIGAREFKEEVVNMLLRMFGISHARNTVVGNQFVRGVSGGERKRVSCAEMMITKATVCCWDSPSRGLDSSTALDYIKSLRIITNIYKTTTFVSLYQASENIYAQFDKVLVISEGQQVFYGSTADARTYFESLGYAPKPRQTTPDYLTGCTDPFEREYAPERSESDVPSTSSELGDAFRASHHWTRINTEIESYKEQLRHEHDVHEDFEAATAQEKRHGARAASVYTIPFYLQVWALVKRQTLLKWQDKFALVVNWATSILIAIVLATTFYKLPETSAGAFSRGGIVFMSLLFNGFQAFSELAGTMLGRQIVNKHKAYAFYRPSALWVAQVIVDLAFAGAQILAFCIIVYFMCGLVLDAGGFFVFVMMILMGYLCMTLFFRTIGCMCPDFDYAIKFASFIITIFVITAGYLIPYAQQGAWIRWCFYLNPFGLGFSAMMMDQFKRLTFACGPESLLPSGPEYDAKLQTCTLLGSKSGSTRIEGSSYINATYGYNPSDQWRYFGILLALICAFLIANILLGELVEWNAAGKTVTYFVKETPELKKLNERLYERRQARLEEAKRRRKHTKLVSDFEHNLITKEQSNIKISSKSVLTWESLCYEVPVPGSQRRLLDNVFGYVKPGELTALMGASGAGKTTLLDVLANRKNIGVITGDVLVDGHPKGASFQRGTSYAEQLDTHEPTQTVREALRFSAYLRQPYHVTKEEKDAYVEECIELLEMQDIADAIIGDPTSGLSVEARKRVTIGVELAAKPELLLFLDEPSSGLDSQSAFNIIRFLKKLAGAGQAILCTIHQPASNLFESFDRLLLLQRGGQCVYFGDIGRDADTMIRYFVSNGAAPPPPNANPAEWMLGVIGAGNAPRQGTRDWSDIWRDSAELVSTKAEIERLKSERSQAFRSSASIHPESNLEYATPLLHQLTQVVNRTNLSFYRSPNYGFSRLFTHVAVALLTGLIFLHLDDSTTRQSLQYRIFLIFQCTVLPALILAQVEPKYDFARRIFWRESSSKMYSQFAFTAAMVLAEMPCSVLSAVAFFVSIYFPAFPRTAGQPGRSGYQFLMLLVSEIFSVTLGQLIAAITPNTFVSSLANPPIMVIMSIFCGVTIVPPLIPKGWNWLYHLNPFTRLVSGMVATELHNIPIRCAPEEVNRFRIPGNVTSCQEYMAPFLRRAGGYVTEVFGQGGVERSCEYCKYKVGDEFLRELHIEYGNRWRDLGVMCGFVGCNLVLLFLASRFMGGAKR